MPVMKQATAADPQIWKVFLQCGHDHLVGALEPSNEYRCTRCEVEQMTRWVEEEQSRHNAMRDVCHMLKGRGIPCEFHHTGGGLFAIRCLINGSEDYCWYFGVADDMWGGDWNGPDLHRFSVETSYPATEKPETVCNWIWSLLSIPPFYDAESGQQITFAYYASSCDATVDPWETYDLPLPDGAHIIEYASHDLCDNCGNVYLHKNQQSKVCARCAQPDPQNQE